MSNLSEAFVTVNMHSENADQLCEKDRELYLTKSDPEECECDAHGIEFRKTK
jgi:hypothetical protein